MSGQQAGFPARPDDAPAGRPRRRSRLARGLTAPFEGITLYAMSWLAMGLCILQVNVLGFMALGVGLLVLPFSTPLARWVANGARGLAHKWQGVEIPRPYRRKPAFQKGFTGLFERCRWILTDPATWRDLAWSVLDPIIGGTLALLAALMLLYGVWGVVISALWNVLLAPNRNVVQRHGYDNWYTFVHVYQGTTWSRWTTAEVGAVLILLSFWTAPALLRAHARWTKVLLAPTRRAVLARRVEQLTESRAVAVDAQAAELRRIERDLHDGAQARLVAMGMNLGAADALLDEHPEQARALLLEARDASAKALTELRQLVRGIHPPVLADRGLADAVRALALDSALDVQVHAELPGRVPAPVESAAYFAVSELLTNAAKHAHAARVWIDVSHTAGMLRLTVSDDGRGGVDPARGTGLRGVERRIGTFDGLMTVTSPPGGPTAVTLEIPCEVSAA